MILNMDDLPPSKDEKYKEIIVLGIVGSRNFTNKKEFTHHIEKWIKDHNGGKQPDIIVSGGAKGADALAKQYATTYSSCEDTIGSLAAESQSDTIKYEEFPADWKKYGPAAGPKRNTQIVERCTHILAFPSREGRGTQDTIRKARKKGISVTTIYID